MEIVWLLVHKLLMVHVVLKYVPMLVRILIQILDVNHIHTNVSPMVLHAFSSQLVKQLNLQLLVKVIQVVHQDRFV